jgi:hypothetical protein
VEVSDALFEVVLSGLLLLLGFKSRTTSSGGGSVNNPRTRSSEGERSKGFWRRLLGGRPNLPSVASRVR